MVTALGSGAAQRNPEFIQRPRNGGDNIDWLTANAETLGDGVVVGLIGGWSQTHLPLRMAQSGLRHDRTPSNWSHVFLFQRLGDEIRTSEDPGSEAIYEISLDPPGGFGFAPLENGVQTPLFKRYRSAHEFPNIAIFSMAVETEGENAPPARVAYAVGRFRGKQGAVDATPLIIRWLGYVWQLEENPLLEGHGMPSAALVEELAMELGFDLTPGLESRAGCPEAIWQAACWWHEYYSEVNRRPLKGAWWTPHKPLYDPGSKKTPRKRARRKVNS